MTPSTITHRGMTVEISDELTFRIASLLWEDLSKLWAGNGNVPNKIPKQELPPGLEIIQGTERMVREKKQEPENKPVNRTLGGKGYTFIRNAKTLEECFIKFPNVPRANIERIWYNAYAPVKEEPVKVKEPEKKVVIEPRKGCKKGGAIERWMDRELSVVRGAATVDEAVKIYREKFPDSPRNDNAVRQRFNKLHTPGNHNGAKPKFITPSAKKEQTPNKTQVGGIVLPDELKPLEEKKAFFIGAQVKQVAGRTPHAMGTGDIIEIKANGDIVVEFYHERKTLKRDELAFYSPPNPNTLMKVRS